MPLPVGTWTKFNANGIQGSLSIPTLGTPDTSGNAFFQGAITFGTNAPDNISGFWDEAGQKISFLRLPSTHTDYSTFQVYHGKLFSFTQTIDKGGVLSVQTSTLAGDVEYFSLSDSTAAWVTLANPPGAPWPGLWCAQISVTTDKTSGKDTKDVAKDGKEGHKDIVKESLKELIKETELEKLPEVVTPPRSSSGASPVNPIGSIVTADQLALRVTALEQHIAIGRSFIMPEERPIVGAGVATSQA
jgi:hypothetical protein